MFELWLIGAGTGNPHHLTREGAAALAAADLVLIPSKGADKSDLADVRRAICDDVLGIDGGRVVEFDMPVRDRDAEYLAGVAAWHDAVAEAWRTAISAVRPAPRKVAMLVWGDPSLYDSTLRIAERLDPPPRVRVVPGITALQALTAAHRIPLNDVGAPVLVTTGRRLREEGWPTGVDRVAVMLDGACAFQELAAERFDIWWGAYLGMPQEMLAAGPLAEAGPRILEERAVARARSGWIMDVYLLARRP